jgi:MFS family permease
VSGVAIAAIPLLHQSNNLSFPVLFGFIFLGALLAVPRTTACRSMLPELADLAGIRREQANATFESLQYLSYFLGPPLAGVLIAVIDATGVLWIDASTFAVSAVLCVVALPGMALAGSIERGSFRQELVAGLQFLASDRLLLTLAISLALTNFLGNSLFAVVLPVYTQAIGATASQLGLIIAAQGAGSLLGAMLYGTIGQRFSRRTTWIIGYSGFAVMLWVVVLMPPFAILLGAFLISGIAGGPLNPLSVTVRQERIPVALRGRVFSTFSAIAMVSSPFGIIAAGALIETTGLAITLIIIAGFYSCICLGMLLVPTLKDMDQTNGQHERM